MALTVVSGTDKKQDYCVVAVKNGMMLAIKGISEVRVDFSLNLVRVMLGFRLRGAPLPVQIGDIVPMQVTPQHRGKMAMKAFPLMPFAKTDENRASFDRAVFGVLDIDKFRHVALDEKSHKDSVQAMFDELYSNIEEYDYLEDKDQLVEFMTTIMMGGLNQGLKLLPKEKEKPVLTKIDDKVTQVDFGNKKNEKEDSE